MKEISCPYYWICGKKFQAKELTRFDFNFLQSAIEKKMKFMFIHCPKCTQSFQFDPIKWKSTARFPNPHKKATPQVLKTKDELLKTLQKSKIEIPKLYISYIKDKTSIPEISIFPKESKFRLYGLEELCKKIKVDEKPYLIANQLKGFANSLKSVFSKSLKTKNHLSLKELAKCISIGEENTRILFIDIRDNETLWVLYTDNGDIVKTKQTLSKIVSRKK